MDKVLATLNCCLDPVVYYFTSESFQKSLTTGTKSPGARQESNPRSDTHLSSDAETNNFSTLTRDTRRDASALASNGKETGVSETQF